MSYSIPIVREAGGSKLSVNSGGSIGINAGGAFSFGDARIYFGSDLPTFAAVAGAIYFRGGADAGSAANIYVNTTNSASTGAVWSGTV
jgi:hypothetical protein